MHLTNAHFLLFCLALTTALVTGCASDPKDQGPEMATQSLPGDAQRTPQYDRAGMTTFVMDGRLWVFGEGSDELAGFCKGNIPEKNVALIGEGPNGMTVKAMDRQMLDAYLGETAPPKSTGAAELLPLVGAQNPPSTPAGPRRTPEHNRSGYETWEIDGRLWVFPANSKTLASITTTGLPEKNVALIGEGPNGMTLKAEDKEILTGYLAHRPGFACHMVGGRLWVFREGSEDHTSFLANGAPEKCITLIGEGPDGVSLRATDRATAEAYLADH